MAQSAGAVDSLNECPGYYTLKLWGMQSIPLLPSLPGLLRPGVVASDRILSMGQIELTCDDDDEVTFSLVSLFNGISTFMSYLIPKASL